MAIVLSGTTNDITVNGVSVATDAEVSSAVASGVAPKANTADLKEIGVEQTWQDVTASRVLGTTYTNSTGKPIQVNVHFGGTIANATATLTINGTVRSRYSIANSILFGGTLSAIIPNGSTYSAASNNPLGAWHELR